MFVSFKSIKDFSSSVGGSVLVAGFNQSNNNPATTIFKDSTGPVIKISFLHPGTRGNNFVANLLKITGFKFRFRLYDNVGTRLNTITEDRTGVSPPDVIEKLVDSINSNATFKKYIHATFIKESTSAFSASINIGDGQRLTGGR